jgi:hypothetical protein
LDKEQHETAQAPKCLNDTIANTFCKQKRLKAKARAETAMRFQQHFLWRHVNPLLGKRESHTSLAYPFLRVIFLTATTSPVVVIACSK